MINKTSKAKCTNLSCSWAGKVKNCEIVEALDNVGNILYQILICPFCGESANLVEEEEKNKNNCKLSLINRQDKKQ